VSSLTNPSPVNFLIAVAIDAALAALIFRHADRYGSRHATVWDLFTFLAALIAIPGHLLNHLDWAVVPGLSFSYLPPAGLCCRVVGVPS
jgi:hypothetical protein